MSEIVTVGGLEVEVRPVALDDAGELFTLQRACWLQEALANPGVEVPATRESLEDLVASFAEWAVVVGRLVGGPHPGRLVLSGRGKPEPDGWWDIGRIMVAPDLQGRGLGRWVLSRTEDLAPDGIRGFVLFTGWKSHDNIRMYQAAGYALTGEPAPHGAVVMRKPAS